jgi:hypothetical protein
LWEDERNLGQKKKKCHRTKLRKRPSFPHEMWNKYEETLNGDNKIWWKASTTASNCPFHQRPLIGW